MRRSIVGLVVLVLLIHRGGEVQAVQYSGGTDFFLSEIGTLEIEVLSNPFGLTPEIYTTTSLAGYSEVLRENPLGSNFDGDDDRLTDIATKFLQFEHSGQIEALGATVQTHQSTKYDTKGVVEEKDPGTSFEADSFFDVFFELDVTMGSDTVTLYNQDALRMTSVIDDFPPSVDTIYEAHQGPLSWWPEEESAVDDGYPWAPDWTTTTMRDRDGDGDLELELRLYIDTPQGTVHMANLIGHPEHAVVPEASSIVCWCLVGLTFAGLGWRRRRRKVA